MEAKNGSFSLCSNQNTTTGKKLNWNHLRNIDKVKEKVILPAKPPLTDFVTYILHTQGGPGAFWSSGYLYFGLFVLCICILGFLYFTFVFWAFWLPAWSIKWLSRPPRWVNFWPQRWQENWYLVKQDFVFTFYFDILKRV